MEPKDKASAGYWSTLWQNSPLSPPISISRNTGGNYLYRILHEIYVKHLGAIPTTGKTLLEIGCGNSSWMTYFAIRHGMQVSGIDYSQVGCDRSQKILARDNVQGKIYFGNFFNPPADLPRNFDFVYSGGVVEHFDDTVAAVNAFASFLKQDGIMITTLPNMAGFGGWVQKTFNKPVYNTHIPLTKSEIISAHEKAGMEILHAQYYGSISLYVNLESVDDKEIKFFGIKKLISKGLSLFSKAIWKLETMTVTFPPTAFLSPGIIVIARKK